MELLPPSYTDVIEDELTVDQIPDLFWPHIKKGLDAKYNDGSIAWENVANKLGFSEEEKRDIRRACDFTGIHVHNFVYLLRTRRPKITMVQLKDAFIGANCYDQSTFVQFAIQNHL